MEMSADDQGDRLIVNRYQRLRLLGEGAMGKVYLAKDIRLLNTVAIKFLNQPFQSLEMCDRFQQEAQICAQLGEKSHYIVKVTDYGVDETGTPFYVMEYLQGHSLQDLLARQPLSLKQFFNLSQQLCLGLQCAHQGVQLGTNQSSALLPVIHCDLKPSNVLITPDEMLGEQVKILDFGIARLMQTRQVSSRTVSGTLTSPATSRTFSGTLPYSSPEQVIGNKLDQRSDIYSLGIVFFEMLTRRLPLWPEVVNLTGWIQVHHTQPPRSFQMVAPDVTIPKALEDLVMSCLAKSPSQRPQSVGEVLAGVRSLLDKSHFVQPQPPTSIQSTPNTDAIAAASKTFASTRKANEILIWPPDVRQLNLLYRTLHEPEALPSLWIKFPHRVIQTLQIYRLYNQIYVNPLICDLPYHPMMLWITAIHNPKLATCWIPYFLDLKHPAEWETLRLLAQVGKYRLLLFDTEAPHWRSHSIDISLKPNQTTNLRQRAIESQMRVPVLPPTTSRELLVKEFNRLKPIIEQRFQNKA